MREKKVTSKNFFVLSTRMKARAGIGYMTG
jgi:hypothetical protein